MKKHSMMTSKNEERVIDEIVIIDCEYIEKEFAASYLILNQGRAAFIDNNTSHCVPRLMNALRQNNISPEKVDFIIITHVHLDHAGGTSALMAACPNAKLLAHPRAMRHMIDPSKLISSAQKVYGASEFERLYGTISPIPESRTQIIEDSATLNWNGRLLDFLHTRGHANHHMCILDRSTGSLFSGDAFGLAYPALQSNELFILPSTSPTDFDPQLAKQAIDRIVATNPQRILLTHFGTVTEIQAAASQLKRHLDFSEILLEEATKASTLDGSILERYCTDKLTKYYSSIASFTDAQWNLLKLDLSLNGSGIAYVAQKRRKQATEIEEQNR